jgi:hypothetical protein
MTVEAPKRAVGAGSKRLCVREPARSVSTKKPCHITLNWSMFRRWSGRQEKASGQQIEPRSAIHVPLQHLQPIDMPFDRALTPGQGHRRLVGLAQASDIQGHDAILAPKTLAADRPEEM